MADHGGGSMYACNVSQVSHFVLVMTALLFWGEVWPLSHNPGQFENFLKLSNFLISQVLSRSTTRDTIVTCHF